MDLDSRLLHQRASWRRLLAFQGTVLLRLWRSSNGQKMHRAENEPPQHDPWVGVKGMNQRDKQQQKIEQQKSTMVDKRKARIINRTSFMPAIQAFRNTNHSDQSNPMGDPANAQTKNPQKKYKTNTSIQAFVRKRPLLQKELDQNEYDAFTVSPVDFKITAHACLMKPDLVRMYIRHHTFRPSAAFDDGASPQQLHEAISDPLVNHALKSGTATLFLYGQTGSGKTFSLRQLLGFIVAQLFDMDSLSSANRRRTRLSVSAIEVLGKKCTDLLTGFTCVPLECEDGSLELSGSQCTCIDTSSGMQDLLRRVLESRATEATAVNATSSRSHMILTMDILQTGNEMSNGRLTLVDCAGSEWNADSSSHNATRRREGAQINVSLHALKQCVRAHARRIRGEKNVRMPFRDSLLTRMLAPSFDESRCRLAVLGCVSPNTASTEHSISTLRTVMELAGSTTGQSVETTEQPVRRAGKRPLSPVQDKKPRSSSSLEKLGLGSEVLPEVANLVAEDSETVNASIFEGCAPTLSLNGMEQSEMATNFERIEQCASTTSKAIPSPEQLSCVTGGESELLSEIIALQRELSEAVSRSKFERCIEIRAEISQRRCRILDLQIAEHAATGDFERCIALRDERCAMGKEHDRNLLTALKVAN